MNKYWAAFWAVSFIYGSSFGLNRILLSDIYPIQLGFLRYIIAALGLHLILLCQHKRLPHDFRLLRNLTLAGIANHGIPFMLISWAQTHIDSGLASVFLATMPIYSLVLAHFFYSDERMTPPKVFGIMLGFAGILILTSRNFSGTAPGGHLAGEVAILISAIISAVGVVYSRHVMRGQIDTIVMATGTMTAGALVSLLALVLLPPLNLGTLADYATDVGFKVTGLLIVVSLFNTMFANLLFYYVLSGLGASRSSLVTYVVPPVSLILGAIFLNEVVDETIILGTGVILIGLAMTNLSTFVSAWLRQDRLQP